jgi:hypothetical protein
VGDKKYESGEYRMISDRHAIAERRSPKPGRDYPARARDLHRSIATDADAWRYLEKLRFPRGYLCPTCQLRREPLRNGPELACPTCNHVQRVTDATIFDGAPRGTSPSAWLRMLWDEAEGPVALGPSAVALLLDLADLIAACAVVDRLRAVEAWLTSKPLTSASDVGLARARVGGPLRHGERSLEDVWIAVVVERASDRLRLRHLHHGQPSELYLAIEETVAPDAPLFTELPRVAAALEARRRSCTLSDATAGPPTRELAESLASWLAACPEASMDLLEGYLAAFSFRNDTQRDPPGARFYRLATAAMRFSPARAEAFGVVG